MRSRRLPATAVTLLLAGSLALAAPASAGPPAGPVQAPSWTARHGAEPAGTAGPNQARCFALFATAPPAPAAVVGARPTPTTTVVYGPAELRAAYAIPSSGGDGQVRW